MRKPPPDIFHGGNGEVNILSKGSIPYLLNYLPSKNGTPKVLHKLLEQPERSPICSFGRR